MKTVFIDMPGVGVPPRVRVLDPVLADLEFLFVVEHEPSYSVRSEHLTDIITDYMPVLRACREEGAAKLGGQLMHGFIDAAEAAVEDYDIDAGGWIAKFQLLQAEAERHIQAIRATLSGSAMAPPCTAVRA